MEHNKKKNEKNCLDSVIKSGKMAHGETKKIISYLSGIDIDRETNERPDFLRYISPKSKQEKGTLVGIEHFRVDHLSTIKSNGDIASTGIVQANKILNFFKNNKDVFETTTTISDNFSDELAKTFSEFLTAINDSSYEKFLNSFKYSLQKHIRKANIYKENIKNLNKDRCKIKIAFLIEIHTEFHNLYLCSNKKVFKNPVGNMPLFQDIINILENVDKHLIDYIILCNTPTLSTPNVDVIALHTGNIKRQLKIYNTPVYEYFCPEKYSTNYKDSNFQIVPKNYGSKIDLEFYPPQNYFDELKFLNANFKAFKDVHHAVLSGKNYATTLSVQFLEEVMGPYLCSWGHLSDSPLELQPVFKNVNIDSIMQSINHFERKYHLARE